MLDWIKILWSLEARSRPWALCYVPQTILNGICGVTEHIIPLRRGVPLSAASKPLVAGLQWCLRGWWVASSRMPTHSFQTSHCHEMMIVVKVIHAQDNKDEEFLKIKFMFIFFWWTLWSVWMYSGWRNSALYPAGAKFRSDARKSSIDRQETMQKETHFLLSNVSALLKNIAPLIRTSFLSEHLSGDSECFHPSYIFSSPGCGWPPCEDSSGLTPISENRKVHKLVLTGTALSSVWRRKSRTISSACAGVTVCPCAL